MIKLKSMKNEFMEKCFVGPVGPLRKSLQRFFILIDFCLNVTRIVIT